VEDALASKIPSLVMRRFLLKNLGRGAAGGFHWKINLRGILDNYPQLNEAITANMVFEKPALFVHGEKSNYFTPADEVLIRKLFPKAEIQTIPEAGHWVHGEKPEEFVECVLKFL
jgi:pimeloyl-ACP methyl ester carboxylesterase